jgi:hypothetical protein
MSDAGPAIDPDACAPVEAVSPAIISAADAHSEPEHPRMDASASPERDEPRQELEIPAALSVRASDTEYPIADVIPIHLAQRMREETRLTPAAPMQKPWGRRLSKIAASIVVLTAASALVVAADRNAFGSATPWTQAPARPGLEELMQRRINAAGLSPADAVELAEEALLNEAASSPLAWIF